MKTATKHVSGSPARGNSPAFREADRTHPLVRAGESQLEPSGNPTCAGDKGSNQASREPRLQTFFRRFLGLARPARPITRSLKGVESGTRYSRWFDTNTFYQKPIIIGKISASEIDPENFLRPELLAGKRDRKITL